MACPVSAFQSGCVLDQSDVAVFKRRWLKQELAQLSVNEIETE